MAQESIHNGIRVFSLASTNGSVRADIVPELGGTVSSLILRGPDSQPRECLHRCNWFWDPRTEQTRGGIPLLFPICGRLLKNNVPGVYHIGNNPFVLPIHGFAMRLPWEVVESSKPDALRLRLIDSAVTRAMYPFQFKLEIFSTLTDAACSCHLTVTNTGSEPMPYYAGFHPFFATPPVGAGKEQTTFAVHPRSLHLCNETKTDVVGSAPPPAFPMSVANDGMNGLLLEMGEDHESRICFPDGFEIRQTASPIFRYRQFYTLPGESFFCDEPWMAPPGSMNRPGAARVLQPGQSETGMFQIS